MALAFNAQASAVGTIGTAAAPALAGIATGSLMVLWAVGDNNVTNPIADPSGWTRIDRNTWNSNYRYWLGYRVKQAGDSVAIGGGGSGRTLAGVSGYSGGAAFGEVSTLATAGAGTTVDPNAVTINDTASMSVVVTAATSNGTWTPPTNWTERVDAQDGASTFTIEISDRGPGLSPGSLNPGVATLTVVTTAFIAYQIELTASAAAVNTLVMCL